MKHLSSIECNRKWVEANPEKAAESKRKWREANPEKVREYKRKYAQTPKGRENHHKYHIANPEKMAEHQHKYYQTPKGKAKSQRAAHARRAHLENTLNTLTADEWQSILGEHNFKCAYCGCSLLDLFNPPTRDHVTPVSKGGDNTKDNVVPACRSCNSRKWAKLGGSQ